MNNNRNNSRVVVVKKKKFSFQKKEESNVVEQADIASEKTNEENRVEEGANFSHQVGLNQSSNKIRNLDDNFSESEKITTDKVAAEKAESEKTTINKAESDKAESDKVLADIALKEEKIRMTAVPLVEKDDSRRSKKSNKGGGVKNFTESFAIMDKSAIRSFDEPRVSKKAKPVKAPIAPVKQEPQEDFFAKLEKKKQPEKVKKDILKDITIVSSNREKRLNEAGDTSAFLAGKSKYGESKKNPNFYDDANEENERIRTIKKAREKNKRNSFADQDSKDKQKEVTIPDILTVQELANRMMVKSGDLVRELMKMGMMITATKPIDADTAELLAAEMGFVVNRVSDSDIETSLEISDVKDPSKLTARIPVVSVMGHVDHGKTSLLDALRESDVAAGESGGITQHIGASKVKVADGKFITFLDTPGHEAFTAMRLRGAHATDMVILVVAADDGVKEQTVEAINHAKAAGIPIIVAINKIDKEGANPQKVLGELLEHSVIVEAMGGDALAVEVSAKEKINLNGVIDAINLQAELLALKANSECRAEGVVIESKVDKNKGVLATFLVQHGTLTTGEIVVAGTAYGKVKRLISDKGRSLDKVYPSDPVEILGLDEAPSSGESFYVVQSEKVARDVIEYRKNKQKDVIAAHRSKKTLEDIFAEMTGEEIKELSVVVKGDVKGSVEAINNSLEKLNDAEMKITVIHSGVGGITDSDIVLAKASNAIMVAFNVRLSQSASEAESKEVDIRYYSIIYDLIDDIRKAAIGMLAPIEREIELGKGEIRDVFNMTKYGKVAGCYIRTGIVKRDGKCRIIRDAKVIATTDIKALKHYKDDVKEVKTNTECGISFENYTDFAKGDQLEFFETVEEARK